MKDLTDLKKHVIRLNVKEIKKAAIDKNINNDTQLAAIIGVSVTQLWRAKLPAEDPRFNSPGPAFIAGVLAAFGEPFEKFFFLEENDTMSYRNEERV